MRDYTKFYIDGHWVDPVTPKTLDVINPATEQVAGRISLGSEADVDLAVKAARRAFGSYSQTSREERLALLERVAEAYKKRLPDFAAAVTEEMGAPQTLAQKAQAPVGLGHLMTAIEVLKGYEFEERRGANLIVKEAIGVCGFITPWNWPLNQITTKVAPALATGCTMVLKPSEVAPFSAQLFAEVMEEAGVPAGVFNMVFGDGPTVGAAIASHPDIDMVSFTGSTRAGIEVAKNAAGTVKRVAQELGGKSPNIVLDDADLLRAVSTGIKTLMVNSGQSCNAPTRMLVPQERMDEVIQIARETVGKVRVGTPEREDAHLGPVVSETQWKKIQALIDKGVEEGATLVAGGPGKPEGFETGYYVRPTVFANVKNDMTIAREEIFGPVLTIIGYRDEEEAVEIANDTPYGLAAYVQSGDVERARRVASRLRAGQVNINSAPVDRSVPFGGYKQSGNGREWGDHAFAEFLEVKAVLGYGEDAPAQRADAPVAQKVAAQ
jgi:aldehyde dehydrogenase (NAD+)